MASLSVVDICNMALGHCGRTATPIQSLTEQSVEAQTCNRWYDICRKQLLEAHNWGFARKRLTLALSADLPPDQWAFRYQAPADMLCFRVIWNPLSDVPLPWAGWPNSIVYGETLGDAVTYELEASLDGNSVTILTNQDSAIGLYTTDCKLTNLFTSHFVNALAHYMASKMAFALTGKQSIEDKEVRAFATAMSNAAAIDANQGVAGPPRDATVIRARM